MTSRRGRLIEEGARELLQLNGYSVQIIPHVFDQRYPPAHIIATHANGEILYIRIRKIAHWGSSVDILEMHFSHDIEKFRKFISRHPEMTNLHCQIWFYSLTYGFFRFDILKDEIREVGIYAR
jgi:hypothetical protein